jgi:hypothetical protein
VPRVTRFEAYRCARERQAALYRASERRQPNIEE